MTFQFNFKNIISYSDRFGKFISLEDNFFLNTDEIKLINELKTQISNYNCIQLLSNDAALYYLLRKKVVQNTIMYGALHLIILKKN